MKPAVATMLAVSAALGAMPSLHDERDETPVSVAVRRRDADSERRLRNRTKEDAAQKRARKAAKRREDARRTAAGRSGGGK